MQTRNVPTDAVTTVVISLTEEERDFLKERVTQALSVAKSNIQDRTLSPEDHGYWEIEYQQAIRVLVKLGV